MPATAEPGLVFLRRGIDRYDPRLLRPGLDRACLHQRPALRGRHWRMAARCSAARSRRPCAARSPAGRAMPRNCSPCGWNRAQDGIEELEASSGSAMPRGGRSCLRSRSTTFAARDREQPAVRDRSGKRGRAVQGRLKAAKVNARYHQGDDGTADGLCRSDPATRVESGGRCWTTRFKRRSGSSANALSDRDLGERARRADRRGDSASCKRYWSRSRPRSFRRACRSCGRFWNVTRPRPASSTLTT